MHEVNKIYVYKALSPVCVTWYVVPTAAFLFTLLIEQQSLYKMSCFTYLHKLNLLNLWGGMFVIAKIS